MLEFKQAFSDMWLFVFKDLIYIQVGCVEDKTIRQNKSHGMNRAVGILCDATAHAAGVVGKDAAHHARVNGCRIRPDAAAKWFEHVVQESANDAGSSTDQPCIILNTVILPMFGNVHQDPIGDRLPGETRPCRAEGHGDAVLLAEFEERLNLADGNRLGNRLRHEPKI